MGVFIPIETLEKVKILNDSGINSTSIAKKMGIDRQTLVRKCKEVGITLNIRHKSIGRSFDDSSEKKSKEVYKDPIPKIRKGFKVGMKINVEIYENRKGKTKEVIKGLKVIGVYRDFVVLEKKGVGGTYRESISFRDVFTKHVIVEPTNKRTKC